MPQPKHGKYHQSVPTPFLFFSPQLTPDSKPIYTIDSSQFQLIKANGPAADQTCISHPWLLVIHLFLNRPSCRFAHTAADLNGMLLNANGMHFCIVHDQSRFIA